MRLLHHRRPNGPVNSSADPDGGLKRSQWLLLAGAVAMLILAAGSAAILLRGDEDVVEPEATGTTAGRAYDDEDVVEPEATGTTAGRAYFPLAVWFEDLSDCGATCPPNAAEKIAILQDKGINTFVVLTTNSNLDAVEASGAGFIAQVDEYCPGATCPNPAHPAIDGWMLSDEPDLMYGGGSDPWSGRFGWNTCIPIQDHDGQCGYTFLDTMNAKVPAGDMTYVNFGLFMMPTPGGYWYDDSVCSAFVNGWGDIVGMDYYGFTHPDRWWFTQRGAFYGEQIDRIRACDAMEGGTTPTDRKPVWGVVELGHPFDDGGTITPAQTRSATWHEIIAGARGILYFNHNFGGSCPTYSILRNTCPQSVAATSAVKVTNRQITQLAPVLNAATADRYITTSRNIRALAKIGGNDAPFGNGIYSIAGAKWSEFSTPGGQQGTITIDTPDGAMLPVAATVLYEGRSVPVERIPGTNDGRIVDNFASGDTVHIYHWSFQ
jgi:hypothetical protein